MELNIIIDDMGHETSIIKIMSTVMILRPLPEILL